MARTILPVKVHDFRIVDAVLGESDPDAANVVYIGTGGTLSYPFVVARRVSGPGGWYVDTCQILAAGRFPVDEWDRKFELEAESIDHWVTDVRRHIALAGPGPYTLRYSVYGEQVVDVEFEVVAHDPPYVGIVAGPVDAALKKSTIAWLEVPQKRGKPVTEPIWYGYEGGIVYVLAGPKEQDITGLDSASHVILHVRSKDKQSHVGVTDCSIRKLPKGPNWERLARDLLVGRRLNLADGEKGVDRWRKNCEIYALTPIPPEQGTG